MDRPLTIEHGQSRFGRSLREKRLQIALLVALVEGILVLVAILAVVLYVAAGRKADRLELREASWIFAVSQLAVVLVPALAGVLIAAAVVALVLIAVVALVVLLRDRR